LHRKICFSIRLVNLPQISYGGRTNFIIIKIKLILASPLYRGVAGTNHKVVYILRLQYNMDIRAILEHSGSSRFCKEDPGYSRRFLQVIFSTLFFLSILQEDPGYLRSVSDFLNAFFCNLSTFFLRRPSILNEVFLSFLPLFSILQRRPSIFKEVFCAISALFSILQRRPSIFKEVFWQFQHFSILQRRPSIFKEVI
jgi:hypothetical protein